MAVSCGTHVNQNRIEMNAVFFFENESRIAERTDIKINEWSHGHDDDHGNKIGKKNSQGVNCCNQLVPVIYKYRLASAIRKIRTARIRLLCLALFGKK